MRVPLVAGTCWCCIIFVYRLQGFCNATPVNRSQHDACKRLWSQELTIRMMPCYYMCVTSGINEPIHTKIRREIDGTPCWERGYGKCTGGICWKDTLSERTNSRYDDRLQIQKRILHRKKRDAYLGPDTDDKKENLGEPLMGIPTSWPAEGTSSEEDEDEDSENAPQIPSFAPGLKHANITPGSMPDKSAIISKAELFQNRTYASDVGANYTIALNQSQLAERSAIHANISQPATGIVEPVLGTPLILRPQASPSTMVSKSTRNQSKRRKRRRRLRGRKRNRNNGKRRRKQEVPTKTIQTTTDTGQQQAHRNLPKIVINETQSQESKHIKIIAPSLGPQLVRHSQNNTEQERKRNTQISMLPQKSKLATNTEGKPTENMAAPQSTIENKENVFIEQKRRENLKPTITETSRTATAKGTVPETASKVNVVATMTQPHVPLQPLLGAKAKPLKDTALSVLVKTGLTEPLMLKATQHNPLKQEAAQLSPTLYSPTPANGGQSPSVNVAVMVTAKGAVPDTASKRNMIGKMTHPHVPLQPLSGAKPNRLNEVALSKPVNVGLAEQPMLTATQHPPMQSEAAQPPPALSSSMAASGGQPPRLNVPVMVTAEGAVPDAASKENVTGKMTHPLVPLQPLSGAKPNVLKEVALSECVNVGLAEQPMLTATQHPPIQSEAAPPPPALPSSTAASGGLPPPVNVPVMVTAKGAVPDTASKGNVIGKMTHPHVPLQILSGAKPNRLKEVALSEPINVGLAEQTMFTAIQHPPIQSEVAQPPPHLSPSTAASGGQPPPVNVPVMVTAKGAVPETGSKGNVILKMTQPHVPLQPLSVAKPNRLKELALSGPAMIALAEQPMLTAKQHPPMQSEVAQPPPHLSLSTAVSGGQPPPVNVPVMVTAKSAVLETGSKGNVILNMTQPHVPLQSLSVAKPNQLKELALSGPVLIALAEQPMLTAKQHPPMQSEAAQPHLALSSSTAASGGHPPPVNVPVMVTAKSAVPETGSKDNFIEKLSQSHVSSQPKYDAEAQVLRGAVVTKTARTGLTLQPIPVVAKKPSLKFESAPLTPALSSSTTTSGGQLPSVNVPVKVIAEGGILEAGPTGNVKRRLTKAHVPLQQQFYAKAQTSKSATFGEPLDTGFTAQLILGAMEHPQSKSKPSLIPPVLHHSVMPGTLQAQSINLSVSGFAEGSFTKAGSPEDGKATMTQPHHLPLKPQMTVIAKGLKEEVFNEPGSLGITEKHIPENVGSPALKSDAAALHRFSTPGITSGRVSPPALHISATRTTAGATTIKSLQESESQHASRAPHLPIMWQVGIETKSREDVRFNKPIKNGNIEHASAAAVGEFKIKAEPTAISTASSPDRARADATGDTKIKLKPSAISAVLSPSGKSNVVPIPGISAPIANYTTNDITTVSSIESEMQNITKPSQSLLKPQFAVADEGRIKSHRSELNTTEKAESPRLEVKENSVIKTSTSAVAPILSPSGTLVALPNHTSLESTKNTTADISKASSGGGMASLWASMVRFFKETIPSFFTRKI